MPKQFEISIIGWNEYQERSDRSNYVWCKLYHKTITGKFWASSTLAQKAMWVALLCLRNKQEEEIIHAPDYMLAGFCGKGVKTKDVESILVGLIGLGVIEEHSGKLPSNFQENAGDLPANSCPRERHLEIDIDTKRKKPAGNQRHEIASPLQGDYSARALELLHSVETETQEAWIAAYPDNSWIRQEINKATAWIASNQKKAPKRFSRFMGSWLARGWDKHRINIPSNKTHSADPDWKKKIREEERAEQERLELLAKGVSA